MIMTNISPLVRRLFLQPTLTDQVHNSGRFFFNNYRDALDRIKHGTQELNEYLRKLKTTLHQLEENLEEERRYLEQASNKAEDQTIANSAQYVTLLERLAVAE
jgi:flagellar motility protein MotE (MotC chaperone)